MEDNPDKQQNRLHFYQLSNYIQKLRLLGAMYLVKFPQIPKLLGATYLIESHKILIGILIKVYALEEKLLLHES